LSFPELCDARGSLWETRRFDKGVKTKLEAKETEANMKMAMTEIRCGCGAFLTQYETECQACFDKRMNGRVASGGTLTAAERVEVENIFNLIRRSNKARMKLGLKS